MHQAPLPPEDCPALDPGVTLLKRPSQRSPALHRLVVNELVASDGRTLWIDAGQDASSYALYDRTPAAHQLEDLTIARAFTAYQHHTLVERAVKQVTPQTSLLVVPCTAALYQDDDVHDEVSAELLRSSLAHLSELASALTIPVVITCPGEGTAFESLLTAHADRTITSTQTDMGVRFDGAEFETTVYWQDGYWQTTIPYWVELFGCVCASSEAATAAPPMASLEG